MCTAQNAKQKSNGVEQPYGNLAIYSVRAVECSLESGWASGREHLCAQGKRTTPQNYWQTGE